MMNLAYMKSPRFRHEKKQIGDRGEIGEKQRGAIGIGVLLTEKPGKKPGDLDSRLDRMGLKIVPA